MSQFQRNFLADSISINPTVRPIDTFVQAQRKGVAGAPIGPNPATQIAQALGRFDQSLHKYYFEPQHQKMIKEQESNAQQLSRQYENFNAFSAAVDRGEIEHGDNPYLQLFAKELYAKEGANELSIRIAELSDRKDLLGADDPVMAFDQAVEELRADIIGESPDIYFQQAFDRHSSPVISRGANQYAQGLRRFNVDEAVTAYRKNLNTEVNKIYEQLAVGDDVSIESMAAEITNSLDQVKNANLIPDNMRNQMVVSELTSLAEGLSHNDPIAAESVVRILEGVSTGPGSVLVSKSHALLLRERIDRNAELREKEEEREHDKLQEQRFNAAIDLVYSYDPAGTEAEFYASLSEVAPNLDNEQRSRLAQLWRASSSSTLSRRDRRDSQQDELERELEADADEILGKQVGELINEITHAPSQEERHEAVLSAIQFSANPDLSDSHRNWLNGEIKKHTNEVRAKAATKLKALVEMNLRRSLQDHIKANEDFFDSPSKREEFTDQGKDLVQYTSMAQSEALDGLLPSTSSEPPTNEQLAEIADQIVRESEEAAKLREEFIQKKKIEEQVPPDVSSSPISPAQARRLTATDPASKADQRVVDLRAKAKAADSAQATDLLNRQADSQERVSRFEVIKMQAKLYTFLKGFTPQAGSGGAYYGTNIPVEEARNLLTTLSLTRDSGPEFTRRAYLAYRDLRSKYQNNENSPNISNNFPKGALFDPVSHQWVDNAAHWNQVYEEFQRIVTDPESLNRTRAVGGSVGVPESNPNNILWLLHQDNPEWGLDQHFRGQPPSEMLEKIRASQGLFISPPDNQNKE